MASSLDLLFRIQGDSTGAERAFQKAEADQRRFTLAVRKANAEMEADFSKRAAAEAAAAKVSEDAARRQSEAYSKAGTHLLAFGAAMGVALGLAAKAAIDWESAWAGVTKTVNGSADEMAALESGLRDLATTLPATHTEIAAVAEAAGQLGVQRDAILGFTKVMIDLGNTTDLSADQAATSIAQLANVMGTDLKTEVDNFGSALVALGNNGASTESQILEMAQRIGGAGATIGLSEQDVLGFASALSSAGIDAEAGGSAISRVFIDIAASVKTGGEKLNLFAQVAGQSAADFSQAFQDDPARATQAFIEGLGHISDAGGNTFGILDSLGESEIRTRDALLRLANASGLLGTSLDTSSQAWEQNNALTQEADKRYQTTAARLEIAKNKMNDAAIDLGAGLLPALAQLADLAGSAAGAFSALPQGVQSGLAMLGIGAAAVALLGGSLLKMAANAKVAGLSLSTMRSAALGPWGLAITAATIGLGLWANKHIEAKQRVEDLTQAIQADSGILGENTRAKVVNRLESEGLLKAAQTLGVGVDTLTDAALGNTDAMQQVDAAISGALSQTEHYGNTVRGGAHSTDEATQAAWALRDGLNGLGSELDDASAAAARQRIAMGEIPYRDASVDARALSASMRQVKTEGDQLSPTQQELIDKFGLTAAEAQTASDAIDGLDKELRDLLDHTFSVEEASDAWTGALQDLAAQVKDTSADIRGNSAAALANRAAMRSLTEQYAEVLTAMAEHGASSDEIKAKAAELQKQLQGVAKDLGIDTSATSEYTDAQKAVLDEIITQITTPGLPEATDAVKTHDDAVRHVPTWWQTKLYADPSGAISGVQEAQRWIDSLHGKTVFMDLEWREIHLPEGPGGRFSDQGTGGGGSFGEQSYDGGRAGASGFGDMSQFSVPAVGGLGSSGMDYDRLSKIMTSQKGFNLNITNVHPEAEPASRTVKSAADALAAIAGAGI